MAVVTLDQPILGGPQANREDNHVLRTRDLGGVTRTGSVLDEQHAAYRKMSNDALARRDLILALRRHEDHAARGLVSCVVFPRGRCANPEATFASEERCREDRSLQPWSRKSRLQRDRQILKAGCAAVVGKQPCVMSLHGITPW